MADFSTRPLRDVNIGDEVLGVQRLRKGGHLQITKSIVLGKSVRYSNDIVELTAPEITLICTSDHRLLNATWREFWQQARTMKGQTVRLVSYGDCTKDWLRGWLAGVIAGDGNLHLFRERWWRFKFASKDVELRDAVFDALQTFGFRSRKIMHKGKTLLPAVEITQSTLVEHLIDFLYSSESSVDYKRGWLGGFFDAEGYFDNPQIRLAQKSSSKHFETAVRYAADLGFHVDVQPNLVIISDPMNFFCQCRPVLMRKYPSNFGISTWKRKTVIRDVKPKAPQMVYDLTTSTGNFIANGLIVHNCDTAYAFTKGMEADVPWVVGSVIQTSDCKWVCLTGGEPLIQDPQRLKVLIEALHTVGEKVTVETNGTIKPHEGLRDLVDFWSVSPKLSNSGMKDKMNVEALRAFARTKRVQFKFVVESVDDVKEAFTVMDENRIVGPVIFQPQGYRDMIKILRDIALYVRANYSHRNVRVLPQLHVLMYGHRGGV